jgi:hypothetical protein
VTQQEPDDAWARPTTNVAHWATGIGWDIQDGAVAALLPRHARRLAPALGPTAWLFGYVALPLAGVYEPTWKYDASTLRGGRSSGVER